VREDGFTLVEALVALVLGAVVLAAVLSTVRLAAQGAARAQAATADAEGFARAGTVLAGDAAHALWIGDEQGHPLFHGDAVEVDLPEVPRPLVASALPRGPVGVIYRIQQGPGGAVVTRAEAPLQGRGFGAAGVAVPIWQSAGRLEFRFLDAKGDWQAEWSDLIALPRAVAVTDPGDGTPRLVAELPDLLPLACAGGPGPACPLPLEAFP
jgi:prepilin-type N-terminal cleavage/methylation domain-containing protein